MTTARGRRLGFAALAGLIAAVGPAARIAARTPQVAPDPYTRERPAVMRTAGYVSFGPFAFGDGHTSEDVERLLGDEPLHWVETAHFRLGCAVAPFAVRRGSPEWKRSLRAELERLRKEKGLRSVRTTARKLDPWLRTHLIAQRLEDCYARIQADLGVTDSTFPQAAMDPARPGEFGGLGPYLGMREKFSVLIVQRSASCARYTRAYGGAESKVPLRLHFFEHGSLGLCMSVDTCDRLLEIDEALHTHLVYNVAVNLFQGYRAYGHELPPWLLFGLGHYYARRTCPRYPAYEQKIGERKIDSPFWQWDERALGLMRFEAFEPIEDFMIREDVTAFGIEQHIQAWFLVDYLMHARKEQTMRFLHELKDPYHARRYLPNRNELLDRQWVRFEKVFGFDPADLQAEWQQNARNLGHRRR